MLELLAGELHDRGACADIETAIDVMITRAVDIAARLPIRVGVGHADRPETAVVMRERLAGHDGIVELTTYEVGPSVGAHTGPGTIGIVYGPYRPYPTSP